MRNASTLRKLVFSIALLGGAVTLANAAPVGNPGQFNFKFVDGFDSGLIYQASGYLPLAGSNPTLPYVRLNLTGAGAVSHVLANLQYSESRLINMTDTAYSSLL